jgi:ABC-type sugar transport system ATPase subunit
MKIIEFKNVSKYYKSSAAVKDFSLEVEKGERLAILGHSGSGKTTILRLLAGFIAPDRGSVLIDGKIVTTEGKILKEPELRNLGMVFQDLALWPHLTVKGNLEFGLKAKGISSHERDKRIDEILQLTQMEKYIHVRPAELSGGQQQRVAFARALVLHPDALLMDEPLSNLDVELNIQLRKEIIKLHQQIGFTLVYVTHDREEAYEIAERIIVMEDGQIRLTGCAEDAQRYFAKLSKSGL